MWNTQTPWFDVTVVMSIFAIGNILFGHFEEHKPKWQRLLKVALVLGATATLSGAGLRWAAYCFLGTLAGIAAYIHIGYLPRHGINGWTGEPKAKYRQLVDERGRRSRLT